MIVGTTHRTPATASLSRPIQRQFRSAMMTVTGLLPVAGFGQFTASRAYNDVLGMSGIRGKKIAGETDPYLFRIHDMELP